jgi:sterol desaturase/sphingolipid hydroxylase (fatty acid hydroxylase superfamily)
MFIRSKAHPFGRRLSNQMVRTLLIGLYFFYPAGCVLQLLPLSAGNEVIASLAGLALIVAAFAIFVVLAGSSLQRQTQEPESELDERERDERNRAAFQAHSVFSGIVLIGVLYMMLTSDMAANGKLHFWQPTDGSHWNAIFGGLILLSFTLPGAVLAFGKAPPDAD